MIVTCPSGLVGEVRGLAGRDLRVLSDKSVKGPALVDAWLSGIWLKTITAGIYPFAENAPLNVDALLVGDGDYLLIQARIATHGPNYPFSVRCKACRKPIDCEVDLEHDIPVVALPEESKKLFVNGNRFTCKLPRSDKDVVFRLPTRKTAKEAAVFKKQKAAGLVQNGKRQKSGTKDAGDQANAIVESLAARLVEVQGEKFLHTQDKIDYLEGLPLGVVTDLLDLFAEPDCGIQTVISDVECDDPECGHVDDYQLPFEEGFFLPTQTRKKKTPMTTGL